MRKFASLEKLRASYLENLAAADRLSEYATDDGQMSVLEESRLEYAGKLDAVERVIRNRVFLRSMSDAQLRAYNANPNLERDTTFINSPPDVRAKIIMRSMTEREYLNTRYPPVLWSDKKPMPEAPKRCYVLTRGVVNSPTPAEMSILSHAYPGVH